jgi:transmembrane sensor
MSDRRAVKSGEDIRAIEAAAARWFVRLHDHPVSTQTEAEFDAWLDLSAEHRACYMRCEVTMALARGLGDEPTLEADLAETRRMAEAEARSQAAAQRRTTVTRVWLGALAATVVAVVGVGYFLTDRVERHEYQTAVGEQRTITLSDRSTVTLNTDTSLDVSLSRKVRRIDLHHGEAFFSVAHDPSRAFEVWAAGGKVRAVGTQFGVEIDRDEVTVSVLEGAVVVEPTAARTGGQTGGAPKVAANESVRYRSSGAIGPVAAADVTRINAWREGKLAFEKVPLADAIAEYNRYTTRKVVLSSDEIGRQQVSGTLRIGNAESLEFMLRESLGLRVVEQGDAVWVMPQTAEAANTKD